MRHGLDNLDSLEEYLEVYSDATYAPEYLRKGLGDMGFVNLFESSYEDSVALEKEDDRYLVLHGNFLEDIPKRPEPEDYPADRFTRWLVRTGYESDDLEDLEEEEYRKILEEDGRMRKFVPSALGFGSGMYIAFSSGGIPENGGLVAMAGLILGGVGTGAVLDYRLQGRRMKAAQKLDEIEADRYLEKIQEEDWEIPLINDRDGFEMLRNERIVVDEDLERLEV